MTRLMLHFVFALLAWSVQATAFAERTENFVEAAQDAVNWYRLWYGKPTDALSLRTSSSGWAVITDGRTYIAFPDVGLAVELVVDASSVLPRHVEELPRHMDGREAVNAYVQRLRNEAAYESAGKADRFDLPRRQSAPAKDTVRRGDARIVELGTIALPRRKVSPACEEEQLRFVSFVKSSLQTDPGMSICEPKRAIIPRYGIRDPLIFVLVENAAQECGDFVVLFSRKGPGWSYDKRSNRFGDLDETIRHIRARSKSVLAF